LFLARLERHPRFIYENSFRTWHFADDFRAAVIPSGYKGTYPVQWGQSAGRLVTLALNRCRDSRFAGLPFWRAGKRRRGSW